MEKQTPFELQYRFIVVDERPICVWNLDFNKNNLEYLDSIDPGYFDYVADTNLHNILDTDDPTLETKTTQHAALALRFAYSQALETLFALICSAIQAPYCVPAWMISYQNKELQNIVEKIHKRQPLLSNFNSERISWSKVSEFLFASLVLEDKELEKRIKNGFAELFSRFASEFLNESFAEEYNSIKHGLRVRTGGFSLAIGGQEAPGIPAPKEKMQLIGKSVYGTGYLTGKKIGEFKSHICFEHNSRNWDPEDIAWSLHLISISISNIISALRIYNGIPAESIKFSWPSDPETFSESWKRTLEVGVTSAKFHTTMPPQFINPFSRETIRSNYKSGKHGGTRRFFRKDAENKQIT